MKSAKIFLSILFLLSVGFINIKAQANQTNETDITYKIYTYTVVGSNDSVNNNKLSGNLSNTIDSVKNRFNYSNYQLLSTQFQLIKNKGNIEYKSILNNFSSSEQTPNLYAVWAFRNLDERVLNGNKQVGFNSFRFSLQMPVKNVLFDADTPNSKQFNYRQLELTATKISVVVGEPVIFATLPIELSDKTLFFALQIEENK